MTSAADDEAAFGDASASFMRSMLGIGGRVLADLGRDVAPASTLQSLCDAVRELLGADEVLVRLHEDGIGLRGEFGSVADGAAGAAPARIVTDVGGDGFDAPLGRLEIGWAETFREPTPLEEVVAARFAAMAMLVLERHLGKRRQLQAIATEREAFAGEIHDDPVQIMTAVSLQLQRAASRLPEGDGRSAIQQARSMNDSAIERLRHVMFSLHPDTLDEDGLLLSLEAYCESYIEIEDVSWKVTGDIDAVIPLEVAALAFRLSRNALVNVIHHAEAETVTIDVACAGSVLQVVIRDDGVGFDMAKVRHTRVGHLGIPHAVTLARWAAGTYTTSSEPSHGTTVTIELPL